MSCLTEGDSLAVPLRNYLTLLLPIAIEQGERGGREVGGFNGGETLGHVGEDNVDGCLVIQTGVVQGVMGFPRERLMEKPAQAGSGSPSRIRTYDLAVNSRPLYR